MTSSRLPVVNAGVYDDRMVERTGEDELRAALRRLLDEGRDGDEIERLVTEVICDWEFELGADGLLRARS